MSTRVDWLKSNSISLIALTISACAALFSFQQYKLSKQLAHIHIEPMLTTKFDFPNTGNPILLIRNDGDIPAVSLSVSHEAYVFDKMQQKITSAITQGYMLSNRMIYREKLGAAKYIKTELIRIDPVLGLVTAYIFNMTYYRERDMKEFRRKVIYFVDDGSAYENADYMTNVNYSTVLNEIEKLNAPKPNLKPGELKKVFEGFDNQSRVQE